MKRTLSIQGRPKTKGRPRFRRTGNSVVTYTPPETVAAEKEIRAAWVQQNGAIPVDGPISVFMRFSKEGSTIEVEPVDAGFTLRGDIDNYAKLVLDALNGVAFTDDKMIVALRVEKA